MRYIKLKLPKGVILRLLVDTDSGSLDMREFFVLPAIRITINKPRDLANLTGRGAIKVHLCWGFWYVGLDLLRVPFKVHNDDYEED